MDTAARSCETVVRGFLGSQAQIVQRLDENYRIGGAYKTYLMQVSNRNITAEQFLCQRLAVAKTQIAWVQIGELLRVARNPMDRLKINGLSGKLHPSFRATLMDSSFQEVLRRSFSASSAQFSGVSRKVGFAQKVA